MTILLRPWRDKAFRLLAMALIIAGFALASVMSLRAELEQRFAVRTAEMLGGELVLSGTRKPENQQLTALENLRTTSLIDFSTVLVHKDELLLVSARAVDATYPLHGHIQSASDRFGTAIPVPEGPPPGELWVADQVLDRLGVAPGTELSLGHKTLRVTAIVRQLPDQSAGFYSMSPRILFNRADLDATGILGPGTRVRFRHYITADSNTVTTLQDQLEPTLRADQRLEDVSNAEVRSMGPLRQLTLWSNLAVLLITLLCGATVYLATTERVAKRARLAGLLRSFGAQRRQIISRLLGAEFIAIIPAAVTGSLLGFLLIAVLGHYLNWQQSPAGGLALWSTVVAATLLLWLAFALPRLSMLVRIPTMDILNKREGRQALSTNLELTGALAAPVLLAGLITDSLSDLGTLLLLLIALCVGLPALFFPLLKGLDLISARLPLAIRLGLRRLSRRPATTLPLLAALTIAMAVLALAGQTGNQLLDDWRTRLPEQAPNHFVLNLFTDDMETFDTWLQQHQALTQPVYPIVRGRLAEINGEPVSKAVTKEKENRHEALNRDLALTEAPSMLASNKIISGVWHPSPGTVSVESEVAKGLGLKEGDRLTFTTSREPLTTTISSIRHVDWDTFEPNFYFIFTPGSLAEQDSTWLTGFWLPEGDGARLAELMQQLPHITLLDVNSLLDKANEIIRQASGATALLALLMMLSAILVLAAALLSGQMQRGRDNALLRTLGGNRALLHRVVWAEFLTLCGSAAAGATFITLVTMHPITTRLMSKASMFSTWQLLPLLLGLVVTIIGIVASSSALNKPALSLLREES